MYSLGTEPMTLVSCTLVGTQEIPLWNSKGVFLATFPFSESELGLPSSKNDKKAP